MSTGGRPVGQRNHIPGRTERAEYLRRLRREAAIGDLTATGMLIMVGMFGSALKQMNHRGERDG